MKLNKLAVCCALALPFLYGCNTNESSDSGGTPPPTEPPPVALEFETVPTVRNWEETQGNYQISANSRIVINSDRTESTLAGIKSNISETAGKFQEQIQAITGLNLSVDTSGTIRSGDISLTLLDAYSVELGDEGYSLKIGDVVEIEANTNTGLFYGTVTVLQQLQKGDDKTHIPRGEVTDYPSLPQRGVMIDAGRKYWKLDSLKDIIRQLGWIKMNRLHLHVTEWNAFRLDSDKPELEGLAALGSYTKEDIAELEEIARLNHVVIIPEIDIPGHGKIMADFNKDAAFACPSMSHYPRGNWEGADGPRWTLDYTGNSSNSPDTGRQFMLGLIEEFAPWFSGPYFHIGTDEVPEGNALRDCPEITEYINETELTEIGDPLVEFINEADRVITGLGKNTRKWSWYERTPTSRDVSADILVDGWTRNGFNYFLEKGNGVFKTGDDFSLGPGFEQGVSPLRTTYTWNETDSPVLQGISFGLWTDLAHKWPDQQFEYLMFTHRSVTAERNWFGPHEDMSTLDAFTKRVGAIGGAPLAVGESYAVPRDDWSVMTVSSEETDRGDGSASNVFNGRADSMWMTRHSTGFDTFPHTLEIDMGDTYHLVGARFQPRSNANRFDDRDHGVIERFSFYISEDGDDWELVVGSGEKHGSFYDVGNDRGSKTIHFPTKTARYFRFVAESGLNDGQREAALAEIDMFGYKEGDDPVTMPQRRTQFRSKVDLSTCMRADRTDGNVGNADTIKMGKCLKTDEYQQWTMNDEGEGYFSIRPVSAPDVCLDVNSVNGTIITWDCHFGDNQLWKSTERYPGYFNIQPKVDEDKCLNINGKANDIVNHGDLVELSGCELANKSQWVTVE